MRLRPFQHIILIDIISRTWSFAAIKSISQSVRSEHIVRNSLFLNLTLLVVRSWRYFSCFWKPLQLFQRGYFHSFVRMFDRWSSKSMLILRFRCSYNNFICRFVEMGVVIFPWTWGFWLLLWFFKRIVEIYIWSSDWLMSREIWCFTLCIKCSLAFFIQRVWNIVCARTWSLYFDFDRVQSVHFGFKDAFWSFRTFWMVFIRAGARNLIGLKQFISFLRFENWSYLLRSSCSSGCVLTRSRFE